MKDNTVICLNDLRRHVEKNTQLVVLFSITFYPVS